MDLKFCIPLKHYNCNMKKIVREFFVQFEIFKFLKFKRISLNTYIFNVIKIPKYFFPHSISNISVNCKVSNSNIIWCERYKKEKLFVRGKKY
jgi:hypothetical protein